MSVSSVPSSVSSCSISSCASDRRKKTCHEHQNSLETQAQFVLQLVFVVHFNWTPLRFSGTMSLLSALQLNSQEPQRLISYQNSKVSDLTQLYLSSGIHCLWRNVVLFVNGTKQWKEKRNIRI